MVFVVIYDSYVYLRISLFTALRVKNVSETSVQRVRESIIQDTLDNILFTKTKEDDLLPLTLSRNPYLISLLVDFIHQKVDSHAHDKKENLRVSLMKYSYLS